jgi:hypothetical protein
MLRTSFKQARLRVAWNRGELADVEGVLGHLWKARSWRWDRAFFRIVIFVCRFLGHALCRAACLNWLLDRLAEGNKQRTNLSMAAALVFVVRKVSTV